MDGQSLLPSWARGFIGVAGHDILHVWIINDNEIHVVSQGTWSKTVYCHVLKREYTFTATRVY